MVVNKSWWPTFVLLTDKKTGAESEMIHGSLHDPIFQLSLDVKHGLPGAADFRRKSR